MHYLKTVPILVFGLLILGCSQKENPILSWAPYDETTALKASEEHPIKRMRYRQILSRLQDKNALMAPFYEVFKYYDIERHKALEPLILEQDITSLQAQRAAGKFNYEELTLFYLYRIYTTELDHKRFLNAIIRINPKVLEAAREKDKQYQKGVTTSPLFGMPILLKDNINTAGLATTAGALAFKENIPEKDAFIVQQLKQQGALILGKANLSEWAYFFCQGCPVGYSALGGQTLNPYGRMEFETGGSSSGSGVAVAANYAVAAIGSETSGSILSPSGKNAVVGLKPTIGALSRSGIIPISSSLDTAGPMTKTVLDNALLFNAMLGKDTSDAKSYTASKIDIAALKKADLNGKVLGYIEDYLSQPLYAEAVKALAAAGAQLLAFTPNTQAFQNFGLRLGAEMKRDLPAYVNNYGAATLPYSSIQSIVDFNLKAMTERAPYGQGNFDNIVKNATTDAALSEIIDQMTQKGRDFFAPAFDTKAVAAVISINNYNAGAAALAYYPALTLPMGIQETGEPQNLTFIALSGQEQLLYELAAAYENKYPQRIPPNN